MNLKSQASMGFVVTCLASAAMASPAAAAATVPVAPVDVPLHGLGTVLPETPTLRTGVPIPLTGAPMGLTAHGKGQAQPVLLPQLPVATGVPETLVSAPLPNVVEGEPTGRALISAPASAIHATTPGAILGLPITLPHAESLGLPGLKLPEAGFLAPTVTGALDSTLGLAQQEN
ncbi:hypothetical protein AMK26_24670 [Streptomyces sp. CB03234]|uniref:hypothetical protein n=1 Tax=Streptomyces sp. (strain CB03234) TaxID=1703937 RepID=UPI00093C9D34|nr:hypothetical protein [Streptomyces sp. CB03234]OKK02773.1 hypothetical protein AMK26_24670 [Streptomyces sp. CB03234]